MSLPVALLGRGGHAKVVMASLQAMGRTIAGWIGPGNAETWRGIPGLGDDDGDWSRRSGFVELALGVGEPSVRQLLFGRYAAVGFHFPAIVHPSAQLGPGTELGAGCQILAGAVVQPDCRLGRGAIINTLAGVDHDCNIGDFAHAAPGVTLCGGVSVGEGALIGAGATVAPGVVIGARAIVGAGSVVIRDVPADRRQAGNPARPLDD